MELLRRALARTEQGETLALVTVTQVSGSAPRHVGAKMLVDERGGIEATIGGGRIELSVTAQARDVAAGAPAQRVHHHLTRDLAMCCGGSMGFYIEPVAPSVAAIRRASELMARRVPCVLVTRFDGSPKHVVQDMAADMPADTPDDMPRRPLLFPVCEAERLLEPILPSPRAIVFGCGHVSRALGPMAAQIGFEVILCDDGDTDALRSVDGAPWLSRTVDSFDIRDVEAELGPLGLADHALIMTRDHAIDQEILERLLPRAASLTYLGLIGSRGKIARFHKRLRAKGLATDENWARLRAPIGVPIGAETPEEIAVSVVAELVKLRRGDRV